MYDAKRNRTDDRTDFRGGDARTSRVPRVRRDLHRAAWPVLLALLMAAPATARDANRKQAAGTRADRPDAVYELWEQEWTLKADGSVVYHEKKHVRLNSDRTFRAFGDPRITYDTATDKLEVLEARTRRADGSYVKLPDYAAVEVAPDAAGGWPAFASLRQRVLVMPAIEPGCVLEIEYRITSRPGSHRDIAADLRIDDRYPVRARTITVTVPRGRALSPIVSGLSDDDYLYSFEQRTDGSSTHRWIFANLPGAEHEPQMLPWPARGVRLAFTTAGDEASWVRGRLGAIDAAADESPLVTNLAAEWTKDCMTDAEKLAALHKHLADTFNFVTFDVTWRPTLPRKASVALGDCYGLPAEAAAALLALSRAAGVAARPALLVDDERWDSRVAQPALVAAYVLLVQGDDGPQLWHARHGRIGRDRHWAGHTAIYVEGDKLARLALPAWTDADESRCHIAGQVDLGADRRYTGKLAVRSSGLFAPPTELDDQPAQRRRLEALVGRLMPGAKVEDFTVRRLGGGVFEAELRIAGGPLDETAGLVTFTLGQTDPALGDVSIPHTRSVRHAPARLVGAFDERIDLTVSWPDGWKAAARPGALERVEGAWGQVEQTVRTAAHKAIITRVLRINQRDLPAAAVGALRAPLNELRSDHARTLLLEP